MKRLLVSGFLAAALQLLLAAAPAHAAITCSYSSPNVTLNFGTNSNGFNATIVRNGMAIYVNGAPCGAATVSNTNKITVNGDLGRQNLTIDLSGGAFEPSLSNPSGEITFALLLGPGTDSLAVNGSSGDDTITVGASGLNLDNDGHANVTGLGSVEQVSMSGNDGADTLSAAGGLGTGSTWLLRVSLTGGLGNDTITGGAGPDNLYGSEDNDTITGGDGNDYLNGGTGADTIHGGAGSDTIDGGLGPDTITGDEGNDSFYAESTTDRNDVVSGGDGRDSMSYYGRSCNLTITLDGSANDGCSGENDNLNPDIEDVSGGKGNDTITGDAADNTLNGYGGSDTVNGLGGNDYIVGGYPYIDASGADTLDGGDGNDNVYGYNGADHLNGGAGDDQLSGGQGNDIVDAGAGNDNVYSEDTPDGTDTYTGGLGQDYITYYGRSCNLTITLDGTANDGCSGENDNVKSDFESVGGGNGDDHITGSAADNVIYGEAGADVLNGKDGVDSIYAGDGADTVIGGDGEDSMYGENGNDSFQAQDGGTDYVDGGADTDTVTNKDSFDTIVNVP